MYYVISQMCFYYALSHYFIPGYSNNHKARLLHAPVIGFFVLLLVAYQMLLSVVPYTSVDILGYAANIEVNRVIELTNEKRISQGLNPLGENLLLTQAARSKGEDMLSKNYWAHVAPDGTEPWKFFIDAGYKYKFAGENLARDFTNANSAVEAWMASPSHRDNLLSNKYSDMGIAVVEGDLDGIDTTIIVQLFGTAVGDLVPAVPIAQANTGESENVVSNVTPTAVVTPHPTATPTPVLESITAAASTGIGGTGGDSGKLTVSPFTSTRTVSMIAITLLLGALVIDGVAVHKRKIPRIAGRTFAHFAFVGMVLAILLIARAGEIL